MKNKIARHFMDNNNNVTREELLQLCLVVIGIQAIKGTSAKSY